MEPQADEPVEEEPLSPPPLHVEMSQDRIEELQVRMRQPLCAVSGMMGRAITEYCCSLPDESCLFFIVTCVLAACAEGEDILADHPHRSAPSGSSIRTGHATCRKVPPTVLPTRSLLTCRRGARAASVRPIRRRKGA